MSILPVLAIESSLGGPYPNSANATKHIYNLLSAHRYYWGTQHLCWYPLHPIASGSIDERLAKLNKDISHHTENWARSDQRFLAVGADHSCALGIWSGVMSAMAVDQRLGLIWLDAHMDAHTFVSSPSGNVHGMPVAALLGQGDSRLAKLYPGQQFLKPENLVFIGVRSFEPEEAWLLQHLRVPIHYCPLANGFIDTLMMTVDELDKHCEKIAISLDLDVIDPEQAPGVATPVLAGIKTQELLAGLALIQQHPKFCGLEISEYYPQADIEDKTLLLIANIIHCMFSDSNANRFFGSANSGISASSVPR